MGSCIFDQAMSLKEEIVENRRYIHKNAEVGFNLINTKRFVMEKLNSYGIDCFEIEPCGVCAILGNADNGKVLLLRADMDALPMNEKNELPFKSINQNAAHCCGHDLHTAMLLTAAKILKSNESHLKGLVKFMFQPSEENGKGAANMVEKGILTNPTVDAALALHVDAQRPLGHLFFGNGCTFASNDNILINIYGKSGHGARPHQAVDPLNAAVKLYEVLMGLVNREVAPDETVVLSVTAINGGNTFNIIPEKAEMKLSLRTYNSSVRNKIVGRMKDVFTSFQQMLNVKVEAVFDSSVPTLISNEDLVNKVIESAKNVMPAENIAKEPIRKLGSEDFAFVTEKIPNSSYIFLGVGPDEKTGCEYPHHNERVIFNEDAMPLGAAILSNFALEYLK